MGRTGQTFGSTRDIHDDRLTGDPYLLSLLLSYVTSCLLFARSRRRLCGGYNLLNEEVGETVLTEVAMTVLVPAPAVLHSGKIEGRRGLGKQVIKA